MLDRMPHVPLLRYTAVVTVRGFLIFSTILFTPRRLLYNFILIL